MSEHPADRPAAPPFSPATICDPRLEPVRGLCDPTSNAFTSDQLIEVANREALPFRHEGYIGRGSSAIIEKVSHKSTKERFALKTFRRVHARHFANDKRAFENEVSIMKRLSSHTHIIKIRGSFICDRELGILMSPVASDGDLGAVIARVLDSGMTAEQNFILNRAFGCLASGLAYIHKHTIRHKDIKPQNILVHDGRVIYTDFGISFDADQQDTTTVGYTDAFTRRYCAPEVKDYANRNRKSDVYSLGCVFVEILDVLEPEIGLRSRDGLPYSEKLEQLRQLLVQSSVTGKARKELFRICYDMLESDQADRIDTSSVLRRIIRLGKLKDSPKVGLYCGDCSTIAERNDTVTQEELVEDSTVLSVDPNPTADTESPEAKIEGAPKKATKKRKNKAVVSSIDVEAGSQPILLRGASSFATSRYYCTACGELGHKASRCPNECWTCDEAGHFARNCPNECDACGRIGHPTDECPNRCWTCGEVGHFKNECPDECFVCGRLGHETLKCKGKCHKCGKIGHWRRDCDDACFECGELGHKVAQCPSKKKKKRRDWRPIFDQTPQGPYRPEPRRRN